jgi:hypothetical protein
VPQADIGDKIIFPVFGFILVKIRELATPSRPRFSAGGSSRTRSSQSSTRRVPQAMAVNYDTRGTFHGFNSFMYRKSDCDRFLRNRKRGFIMANNGGGSIGLLGVLLGGILVLVVGGAVLYATGVIGNKNSVTIQLPKVN